MIDKLEMPLALAREQHFGHAAEACGVTQPTFSAGLKTLVEPAPTLRANSIVVLFSHVRTSQWRALSPPSWPTRWDCQNQYERSR
jgi:hypothetical protein